jgi:2-polyprenyl-6-methoxyphenol hydroxylase-like FAD-dependent oxidoreductase
MGPGSLFGAGRLDERQVRWYAGALAPAAAGAGTDHERGVRDRFGDWASPVPEVIAATDPGAYLFNDAPRAHPLRTWTRGTVILLGDAAHPTLPALATGGGMAIEDAAVLREFLVGAPDVRSALRRYERRRRPLATRIQRAAVGFEHVLAIRRRIPLALRDVGFRFDLGQRLAIEQLMLGGRLRGGRP